MADSDCSITTFTGDANTAKIVFAVTFALVISYCIVALTIFVRRRKVHPINARPFLTTLLCLILEMVWIAELCFMYIHRQNHACVLFLTFGWPLVAVILNVYLSRVWLLWFKFKSTEEKGTLPPLPSFKFPVVRNISIVEFVRNRVDQAKTDAPAPDTLTTSQPNPVDHVSDPHDSHVETLLSYARIPSIPSQSLSKNPSELEHSKAPVANTGTLYAMCASPSTSEVESASISNVQNSPGIFRELSEMGTAEDVQFFSNPTEPRKNTKPAKFSNLTIDTSQEPTEDFHFTPCHSPQRVGDVTPIDSVCTPSTTKSKRSPLSTSTAPSTSVVTIPQISPRRSIFDDIASLPSPYARSHRVLSFGGSRSNVEKSEVANTRRNMNWYLAHKQWGSDEFMLKVFGVKGALEWLLLMSPVFTSNGRVFTEMITDDCWCPSLGWALLTFQVIVVYHAIIMVYAAWRFVKVSDGFYLKKEFKYGAITCLTSIPVWHALGMLPQNVTVFPYTAYAMVLMTLAVFSMSATYPVWMSCKHVAKPTLTRQATMVAPPLAPNCSKHDVTNIPLYSFLTQNENGVADFSAHLKREFSLENLLYWQAVEQYHSLFNEGRPEENFRLAHDIKQRFIDDSSALQINLQSRDYRAIRERIANEEITADLFDTSQEKIFRLMATDSFVRFQNQRRSQ